LHITSLQCGKLWRFLQLNDRVKLSVVDLEQVINFIRNFLLSFAQ
jgi:hypothetical protein